MKITEENRESITGHLPKNYAQLVAKQCNVSESTVYRVLHHGQENEDVADALMELALNTKVEMLKKHKRRLKIAQQLSEDKAA